MELLYILYMSAYWINFDLRYQEISPDILVPAEDKFKRWWNIMHINDVQYTDLIMMEHILTTNLLGFIRSIWFGIPTPIDKSAYDYNQFPVSPFRVVLLDMIATWLNGRYGPNDVANTMFSLRNIDERVFKELSMQMTRTSSDSLRLISYCRYHPLPYREKIPVDVARSLESKTLVEYMKICLPYQKALINIPGVEITSITNEYLDVLSKMYSMFQLGNYHDHDVVANTMYFWRRSDYPFYQHIKNMSLGLDPSVLFSLSLRPHVKLDRDLILGRIDNSNYMPVMASRDLEILLTTHDLPTFVGSIIKYDPMTYGSIPIPPADNSGDYERTLLDIYQAWKQSKYGRNSVTNTMLHLQTVSPQIYEELFYQDQIPRQVYFEDRSRTPYSDPDLPDQPQSRENRRIRLGSTCYLESPDPLARQIEEICQLFHSKELAQDFRNTLKSGRLRTANITLSRICPRDREIGELWMDQIRSNPIGIENIYTFSFGGERGIDLGGPSREVLGKIGPIITREYFKRTTVDTMVFRRQLSDGQIYILCNLIRTSVLMEAPLDIPIPYSFLAIIFEEILLHVAPKMKHVPLLPLKLTMLKLENPEVFKSLLTVLMMPGEQLEALYLSTSVTDLFHPRTEISLIDDEYVTVQNREIWVNLAVNHYLCWHRSWRIAKSFATDLKMSSPFGLSNLVRPKHQVDVQHLIDLIKITYNDVETTLVESQLLTWLQEIIITLKPEQVTDLLVFWTGSPYLLNDYKLRWMRGSPENFPQSHTCFNILDLPRYPSKDVLKSKLLLSISEGKTYQLA